MTEVAVLILPALWKVFILMKKAMEDWRGFIGNSYLGSK